MPPPAASAAGPEMARSWCNGQVGFLFARLEWASGSGEAGRRSKKSCADWPRRPLGRTDHSAAATPACSTCSVHAAGRLGCDEWLTAAGELVGRMLDAPPPKAASA